MQARSEPTVGGVIDQKWRLVSLLGEGGMGKVFAAEHQFMGHRVAIKILSPEALSLPGALQRLQQEALASSRIDHPNIMKVSDFGFDRDTDMPYIVQELLTGETLEAYLLKVPGAVVETTEALALIVPVMGALVAAHGLGIVHRDIKPANIFLAREADGRVTPKLIDFGIAKALTPLLHDAKKTGTGITIGTPSYMAREQAQGVSDIDARVDVWSIGVVLHELLSGRLPYEGANGNLIIGKVLYEAPAPLADPRSGLDPELARAIDGALQPDRELRYKTMQVFLSALQAVTSGASPEATTDLGVRSVVEPRRETRGWMLVFLLLSCLLGVSKLIVLLKTPEYVEVSPTVVYPLHDPSAEGLIPDGSIPEDSGSVTATVILRSVDAGMVFDRPLPAPARRRRDAGQTSRSDRGTASPTRRTRITLDIFGVPSDASGAR